VEWFVHVLYAGREVLVKQEEGEEEEEGEKSGDG